MSSNVYAQMAEAIRCVCADATAAMSAAIAGEPSAEPAAEISLQEDGYRITITRATQRQAFGGGAYKLVAPEAGYLPLDDRATRFRPWRKRCGAAVHPQDLVKVIRAGWPGYEALCSKAMFDTHLENMSSWLRQCVGLGIIQKMGRGYVATEAAKGGLQ